MSVDNIEINGETYSKDRLNKKYEKPLRMNMLYTDGTEIEPFHIIKGYGFINADKVKLLSYEDDDYTWVSVDSFGISKIPVIVEAVYRINPSKDIKKLIGYNYYLDNEDNDLIKSLYYWDDDSVWEKQVKPEEVLDSLNDYVLLLDNSFSDVHELLRDVGMPEWHFITRKMHKMTSLDKLNKYRMENADALESFYNKYSEIKNSLNKNKYIL